MHLLEEQIGYPSEINDYLYLSGVAALDNPELVEELGITTVISVMPNPPVLHSSIRHLVIPIQDSTEVDITAFFDQVFDAINTTKCANSRVLIHCEKGMSRSASFVVAWLLQEQHTPQNSVSYQITLNHLKKIRAVVAPNKGFEKQLKAFERSLNRRFLTNRQLQLASLNKDSHEYYTSFLDAKDKTRLSQVSHFFNKMCQQNKFWRQELIQYAGLTEDVCQLLEDHKLWLKSIYLHCRRLKSKWPIPLCSAYVIGSLGIVSLTRAYLKSNSQTDNLSAVIKGASLNNQRTLIEALSEDYDILKVEAQTHSNILTYATSTNNVELLTYLDSFAPNWRIKNRQHDNLLFIAAFYGNFAAFTFLIEKQVDPTETNKAGDNLLIRVSQSNCLEIAEYIRDHLPHISPFHSNNSKLSPHDLAVRSQKTELVAIYDNWPTMLNDSRNHTLSAP